MADTISDFQSWRAGHAMTLQRHLDQFSRMSNNNLLGSRNSDNSEVYLDIDHYLDPQQKRTTFDQLRLGARFH